MSSTENCIRPNPDIAGIGIRISIYIQSLAMLIRAALYAADGVIDSDEQNSLGTSTIALAITAFSLALAAIIESKTSGLSVYHALVTLNLGWMLIASSLVAGTFTSLPVIIGNRPWAEIRKLYRPTSRGLPLAVFPTTHLLVVASFGIWVWSNIRIFGGQPECTPQTLVVIFGHDIRVTNPALRIVSLVVYSVAIVPVVNVLTIITAAGGFSSLILRILTGGRDVGDTTKARLCFFSSLCVPALVIIAFAVDTELTIQRNQAIIFPGEAQWTFGQTLAMILVLPILADIAQAVQSFTPESLDRQKMQIARALVVITHRANKTATSIQGAELDEAARAVVRFVDDIRPEHRSGRMLWNGPRSMDEVFMRGP